PRAALVRRPTGTSDRIVRGGARGRAVGLRRLDRGHLRRRRGERPGAQPAAFHRAVDPDRSGAVLPGHGILRVRVVTRPDGGLLAPRLRRGAGAAGSRGYAAAPGGGT